MDRKWGQLSIENENTSKRVQMQPFMKFHKLSLLEITVFTSVENDILHHFWTVFEYDIVES